MKRITIVFLLAFTLALVACGGKSNSASNTLDVSGVWGRNSPKAATNGAFYMLINNGTDKDEKLLSASADICKVVELHEMYVKENNVMGMRPVPEGYIAIPAGGSAELKVGGMHVMCIGKNAEFELGLEIPITLVFENAGEVEVTALISEEKPE